MSLLAPSLCPRRLSAAVRRPSRAGGVFVTFLTARNSVLLLPTPVPVTPAVHWVLYLQISWARLRRQMMARTSPLAGAAVPGASGLCVKQGEGPGDPPWGSLVCAPPVDLPARQRTAAALLGFASAWCTQMSEEERETVSGSPEQRVAPTDLTRAGVPGSVRPCASAWESRRPLLVK